MIAFTVLAVVLAAVFVRLGIWQLDRRGERRAQNALIAARAAAPPVPFGSVPPDSSARYRRVTLRGIPDYGQEVVLAARTRNGSPGVHVLTPLRVPGRREAVLVNRGWVYAPDGATAELGKWREGDTLAIEGYVEQFVRGDSAAVSAKRILRSMTLATVRGALPYPVAPVYVVARQPADSGRSGVPARLTLPDLGDEGPHLGYALQWFAFAVIALVGGGIGLRAARRG